MSIANKACGTHGLTNTEYARYEGSFNLKLMPETNVRKPTRKRCFLYYVVLPRIHQFQLLYRQKRVSILAVQQHAVTTCIEITTVNKLYCTIRIH